MRKSENFQPRGWRKWGEAGEAGQALIEAAIAAPLLFLLLMGSAELARVAYMAIEVSNAARAGAEYASQEPSTLHDSPGITNAAQADAANITLTSVNPAIGYDCTDGSTYTPGAAGAAGTCSGSTGVVVPNVTVTTSATFDPLIHIPGLPSAFTLVGTSTETCVDP